MQNIFGTSTRPIRVQTLDVERVQPIENWCSDLLGDARVRPTCE